MNVSTAMANYEANDEFIDYIAQILLHCATELSILHTHGRAAMIGLAIGE